MRETAEGEGEKEVTRRGIKMRKTLMGGRERGRLKG